MPGLFVTATGTEVGKTYVSAGLIRACRRVDQPVAALKPVLSGFDPDDFRGSDAAILLDALGLPVDATGIAALSPWRFRAPLSPDAAAALEGRGLTLDAILGFCDRALGPDRLTIIEGVGGVMVPLAPRVTVLDWIAGLGTPLLLVSPTGLGAISHLLTALEALKARGLAPVAIVLSETAGSTVPLERMLGTLDGFISRDGLFVLRRAVGGGDATFDSILAHVSQSVPLAGRG